MGGGFAIPILGQRAFLNTVSSDLSRFFANFDLLSIFSSFVTKNANSYETLIKYEAYVKICNFNPILILFREVLPC